jgi:hypothetical protein
MSGRRVLALMLCLGGLALLYSCAGDEHERRETTGTPWLTTTMSASSETTSPLQPPATVTATQAAVPTPTPIPTLTDQQHEYNEKEQEVINSLSVTVPVERFREILGPQLFYRSSSRDADQAYHEYVFARPGYWVQAITDDRGIIVFYAITSCALDFRPTIYTEANLDRGIQLQVSTYESVSQAADGSHVFIAGATANSFVFEIDYGEGTDDSLDLAWGWNDACDCARDGIVALLAHCATGMDCELQAIDGWRSDHAFNTVAVGDVPVAIDNFQIGIDRVQVRVYPQGLERATSLPSDPVASSSWQVQEEERINSLSTLVTIETFQRILGPHQLYREPGRGEFVEYSFARPGYWVQAVTDEDGSVVFFAVTSCDVDFRPQVYTTVYGPDAVQLRVTTVDDLPDTWGLDQRGDDEVYIGGGNPSLYQQAYLGNNQTCSAGEAGSFNTIAVSWVSILDVASRFSLGVDVNWVGGHPDGQ